MKKLFTYGIAAALALQMFPMRNVKASLFAKEGALKYVTPYSAGLSPYKDLLSEKKYQDVDGSGWKNISEPPKSVAVYFNEKGFSEDGGQCFVPSYGKTSKKEGVIEGSEEIQGSLKVGVSLADKKKKKDIEKYRQILQGAFEVDRLVRVDEYKQFKGFKKDIEEQKSLLRNELGDILPVIAGSLGKRMAYTVKDAKGDKESYSKYYDIDAPFLKALREKIDTTKDLSKMDLEELRALRGQILNGLKESEEFKYLLADSDGGDSAELEKLLLETGRYDEKVLRANLADYDKDVLDLRSEREELGSNIFKKRSAKKEIEGKIKERIAGMELSGEKINDHFQQNIEKRLSEIDREVGDKVKLIESIKTSLGSFDKNSSVYKTELGSIDKAEAEIDELLKEKAKYLKVAEIKNIAHRKGRAILRDAAKMALHLGILDDEGSLSQEEKEKFIKNLSGKTAIGEFNKIAPKYVARGEALNTLKVADNKVDKNKICQEVALKNDVFSAYIEENGGSDRCFEIADRLTSNETRDEAIAGICQKINKNVYAKKGIGECADRKMSKIYKLPTEAHKVLRYLALEKKNEGVVESEISEIEKLAQNAYDKKKALASYSSGEVKKKLPKMNREWDEVTLAKKEKKLAKKLETYFDVSIDKEKAQRDALVEGWKSGQTTYFLPKAQGGFFKGPWHRFQSKRANKKYYLALGKHESKEAAASTRLGLLTAAHDGSELDFKAIGQTPELYQARKFVPSMSQYKDYAAAVGRGRNPFSGSVSSVVEAPAPVSAPALAPVKKEAPPLPPRPAASLAEVPAKMIQAQIVIGTPDEPYMLKGKSVEFLPLVPTRSGEVGEDLVSPPVPARDSIADDSESIPAVSVVAPPPAPSAPKFTSATRGAGRVKVMSFADQIKARQEAGLKPVTESEAAPSDETQSKPLSFTDQLKDFNKGNLKTVADSENGIIRHELASEQSKKPSGLALVIGNAMDKRRSVMGYALVDEQDEEDDNGDWD